MKGKNLHKKLEIFKGKELELSQQKTKLMDELFRFFLNNFDDYFLEKEKQKANHELSLLIFKIEHFAKWSPIARNMLAALRMTKVKESLKK